MQYKAVILNFDRKSVEYVAVTKVPATPSKAAVATSSGSTPPTDPRSK